MNGRQTLLAAAVLALLPAGAALAAAAGGTTAPSALAADDGAAIYRHVCQGCHMPDGRGAVGAGTIPALAGDDRLEAAAFLVHVVLHGLGGMPPVGWILDDGQVAAVVGYVRTSWGNHWTDAVTPADVAASRPTAAFKPED